MRKLDHPNILKVFELFEDSGCYYIIEEYMKDGDLFAFTKSKGHLPEKLAAQIIKQILSCLAYCHQKQVMHRDIKLENILIDYHATPESDEEIITVKLSDFGSATEFEASKKYKDFAGTALYISPEVLRKKYSEKCDIWSTGILLYIILCGQPPFTSSTEAKLLQTILKGPTITFAEPQWGSITPKAKSIIHLMLEYDDMKRPSAEDLLKIDWIRGLEEDCPLEAIGKAIQNMRTYIRDTRFIQAIIWFVSGNLNFMDEERELMMVFRVIDIDKDSRISKYELFEAVKKCCGEKVASEEIVKICNS